VVTRTKHPESAKKEKGPRASNSTSKKADRPDFGEQTVSRTPLNQPSQRQKSGSFNRSKSQGVKAAPPKKEEKLFGGVRKFFSKISKNEQRQRKHMSTKSKKLPKNFYGVMVEYELKIDSGIFDQDTVQTLIQMYS